MEENRETRAAEHEVGHSLEQTSATSGRATALYRVGEQWRANLGLAWQAALLFALFVVLRPIVFRVGQLDVTSYFETFLLAEALGKQEFHLLFVVPTVVFACFFRRIRWAAIDPAHRIRYAVLVAAAVLAWTFATYDLNLFYDQGHALDRILLALLWIVVVVHPFAFPLFLGLLMVVALQMQFPLPMANWYWPDKRLIIDVVILFLGYLAIKLVGGRRISTRLLPFALLCLVGMTYVHAAVSKMLLGPHLWSWLAEDTLSNLFVAAHLNGGWLNFLADEQVIGVAGWMRALAVPLALGTLLVELSGLMLLLHRSLARILLVGFVLMHIGILLSSGIFFWKWMLFDLALVWVLRPHSGEQNVDTPPKRLFGPAPAVIAIALVLIVPRLIHFVPFAWYDTRLANFFVFEGIAADGDRYTIHPRFFAPYDLLVQQSQFYYLLRLPVLSGTFGVTDRYDVMKALQTSSPDDVPRLQREFGTVWAHEPAARSFTWFVHRYGRNAMKRGKDPQGVLRFLRPPYHFQSQPQLDNYEYQEELVAIEVFYEVYLFTGTEIVPISRQGVLRVPLDAPAQDGEPSEGRGMGG